MKKKFTLIELIAVISILGILAAMIIPNISSFQGEATEVAIKADAKNLQTSVDMYQLDHYGNYPSEIQPEIGNPQPIKFDLLYPKYLREIPKHDGVYYWVDYTGKVWVSPFDSPLNVINNGTTINWMKVNGADYYNVFEIISSTTGSINNTKKLKYLGFATTNSFSKDISSTKTYLVNAVDNEGFESAPVGTKYAGYTLESSTKTESNITVNQAPTAVITMSPEQGLTTSTTIAWDYSSSTDFDGDSIVNAEWKGKQDVYSIEGQYTVELRVQDDKGNWSNWVSKTFYVISGSGIKQILSGTHFTAVLLKDGTIKVWGHNQYGQLGDGTTINRNKPVTVPNLTNVKQISLGFNHMLALLNDGTVKAWGNNSNGQLGDGTNSQKSYPVDVIDLTNVKEIFSGGDYNFALLNDGTVKAWGDNAYGQLGVGNTTTKYKPTNVLGLTNVIQLSLGNSHVLALLNDGTVKTWGANFYGQLGDGTTAHKSSPIIILSLTSVNSVSAGNSNSLAILNDGTIKVWGSNSYGQLGDGTKENRYTPVNMTVVTNVKQIAFKNYHTVVVLNDGTVRTWGYNGWGQLGDGTITDSLTPITVSGLTDVKEVTTTLNSSFALLNDGTVKSWGSNAYGELGYNMPSSNNSYTPVTVVGLN